MVILFDILSYVIIMDFKAFWVIFCAEEVADQQQ